MNKLLVIGNGFDLNIGAKTAYSDFFNSSIYSRTRDSIEEWIDFCEREPDLPTLTNICNAKKYDFTCWDLLFYLKTFFSMQQKQPSIANAVNWCDIEEVIHDSITNESEESFSWKNVYKSLGFYYSDSITRLTSFKTYDRSKDVKVMNRYLIANNWRPFCNTKQSFYDQLLKELIIFERNFGSFIRSETSSSTYKNNALQMIKELTNADISYIDSFNYSDFSNDDIAIRHINGDCDNPIFGINLKQDEEKQDPLARIFTKTARRIQQDAFNIRMNNTPINALSEGAVVFGHSLNDMDYDYFNYLFTMLRLNSYEVDKMGTIEFVHHVYNQDKQIIIRNNYADRVYALIQYYEEYITNSSQHVLLNLLRFSGRLKIREI